MNWNLHFISLHSIVLDEQQMMIFPGSSKLFSSQIYANWQTQKNLFRFVRNSNQKVN